jgi:hypothetical protein
MANMVSPNDLQQAARDCYLEGREPSSTKDWQYCINFWAANIQSGLEESACILIAKIFDCPLKKKDIIEIVKFQVNAKAKAK